MRRKLMVILSLIGVGLLVLWLRPEGGLSAAGARRIEEIIEQGIKQKKLPGAVVLIGHRGRVIYRKAFGHRALEPVPEAMTVDTIFDLSSLTKLVATATSVMVLMERGQLQLSDPIAKYIPEIQDPLARRVSVERLLTHTSGYVTQLDLKHPWQGREGALQELAGEPVSQGSEAQFHYSDINYIALGFIVERISEQSLATFSRDNLFVPLGIADTTTFCPPPGLGPIAPTEWRRGRMLRGSVHSPQAERMGGIAGNGGLFSRADDLARYCQMILDSGRFNGKSVLGPATIAKMTAPVVVSSSGATRGLGWDIDSAVAMSRGEFFPRGSFGHTGYAGVSLWIDPSSQTYVIFLSNMVHPEGKGDVKSLRARLFSVVASSITDADGESWAHCEEIYSARLSAGLAAFKNRLAEQDVAEVVPLPRSRVVNGIDVWQGNEFSGLAGKKVGLVTTPSAQNQSGISTFELLRKAPGVQLVRLLAGPDQGFPATSSWRPSAADLAGLDMLVFDMPDCATRFDAACARLRTTLEYAAQSKLRLVVLDRPNLLGGETVEGPLSDPRLSDNAAWTYAQPLPTRHAMTMGELALMFNSERKIGANLQVIAMDSWERSFGFDQTQQSWVSPDSEIRNLNAALLYPALAPLESPYLSVGKGTDHPYEWFGAPWLDGGKLAEFLNRQEIAGVSFVPGRERPKSSMYKGQDCNGCYILVIDRSRVRSLRVGLEVGCALRRLYPSRWDGKLWAASFADPATIRMLGVQATPVTIEQSWRSGLDKFRHRRAPYLLYP